TDAMIDSAAQDLAAQADPAAGAKALQERYPGAQVRDFDGEPGRPTEMDALIAYLQVLGTMVDFRAYKAQQDLR
ncbi:MAG TPA: cytochrome-c oxidase, cbb3-type subunit II, partial [Rhodospirillales bacterium]